MGDKFLPTAPGRIYIRLERFEDGSREHGMYGENLTEQQFNIFYRGIEPPGYEVIYIDSNYEPLQEPFQPLISNPKKRCYLQKNLKNT